MKRFVILWSVLFWGLTAMAQEYYTHYQSVTEPQTLIASDYLRMSRKEITLPTVNGYTPYKADLHIHSTYTDGTLNIKGRVEEAWCDGLDVISMTDHLSIRVVRDKVGEVTPDSMKVKRGSKPLKAMQSTVKVAKDFGLLVIPGVELTGDGETQGHYNALFIKDISSVYDYDALQAIRNARQQGALIMHNHPGWRRKSLNMHEWDRMVYDEKLIDGIEIMNTAEFYPKAITRALKYNLFMSSNSDIHGVLERVEGEPQRNMTFIYAKDKSLASIREALEAHRTIAYSHGTIAGEEPLLRKFVEASLEVRAAGADRKGKMQYVIKNKSSVEFLVHFEGGNPVVVKGLSSTFLKEVKAGQKSLVVDNAWYGEDKHIVYNFNL